MPSNGLPAATAAVSPPAILLFDWHGTLVDTRDAMYQAIGEILNRLDELHLLERLAPTSACRTEADAKLVRYIRIFRRLPPRVLAERRFSRTDIFDAIFGEDRDAIAIAHTAYDATYRRFFGAVRPFEPEVRRYLEALAAAGIRCCVATNRSREFLAPELERVEDGRWRGLFAATVAGTDVPRRKPAPDVLLRALAEAGVAPGPHAWYVGDSVSDTMAARAAGITSVFYNGAAWPAEQFGRVFPEPATRPDATVDDFDGLLDLVARSAAAFADTARRLAERRPARRVVVPKPAPAEPAWSPSRAALTPPRLVLFDWHATLVDTLDAMYRAVDDTLPELDTLGLMRRLVRPEQSRSADDQKLVEYVKAYRQLHPKVKADRKISRTDIFEVLFGSDEEAKRVAHDTFNRHYRNHYGVVEPFEPQVGEVLVALRALGLAVGVITNRDREFFLDELTKVERGRWTRLFDTAVCGDDAPRRKPHPDQLLLAASRLGFAPGREVWYVGDSTTDTVAARAAGMTAVFFNGAQWDAAWLETIFPGNARFPHQPDVIVEDFSELFALVLATLGRA
jgi:phosphoglycolate phosphatase